MRLNATKNYGQLQLHEESFARKARPTVMNREGRSRRFWISVRTKTQLKCQNVKKMKSRNICILMHFMLNLMTYLTGGKTVKRNSDAYEVLQWACSAGASQQAKQCKC
jgi:hypothetical protein